MQEYPDEILVYDTTANKGHSLNRISATVWRACDGTHTAAAIARRVAEEHGEHGERDAARLTADALAELARAGLLTKASAAKIGVTRRQAIGHAVASVIGVSTFAFGRVAVASPH